MGRTKDYDDYIDWTYDVAGIEPTDFEDYDAYIDTVLAEFPPQNYNDWGYRSRKKLDGELTDYFTENRSLVRKLENAGLTGKVSVITYPHGRPTPANVSLITKFRRQKKSWLRLATVGRRPLSKTDRARIDKVADKQISGVRLNKGELKVKRSLFARRANEIYSYRNKQGERLYSKTESFKLAHKEFR